MAALLDLLDSQTADAQNWVNKFIVDIPNEKWFVTPEVIETNFAWQIGHLTLSQYYYTIVLINGPQNIFSENIPIKDYSTLFAKGGNKKELLSKISIKDLLCNWEIIQNATIQTIYNLTENDLESEVYKTSKPHPFVRTKQESLSWNIKHLMMHCGQIAMLKRIIDKPFDYGI